MTKATAAVKTVTDNSIEAKLAHLKNVIGIERNRKIFSKSVSQDTRLLRFLNAEFTTPTIFKDNKFKEFIAMSKEHGGVMDSKFKEAVLQNIINSKVDDEVTSKVEEFEALPLSASQKVELEAAKSLYKEYLSSIVAKSRVMANMLK